MQVKIAIFAFFCVGVALAYPTQQNTEFDEFSQREESLPSNLELHRAKRQLFIQGGGSRSQGIDFNANARFPIWESQNQRNSLHGTAQYGQHLGGKYGNSPPNYGGGLIFTHRF